MHHRLWMMDDRRQVLNLDGVAASQRHLDLTPPQLPPTDHERMSQGTWPSGV